MQRRRFLTLAAVVPAAFALPAAAFEVGLPAAITAAGQFRTIDEIAGPVHHPFAMLTEVMHRDPEYAWAWHCNLAMAFFDEGIVSMWQANSAASRIMRQFFDIDIRENHYWQAGVHGPLERIDVSKNEYWKAGAASPTTPAPERLEDVGRDLTIPAKTVAILENLVAIQSSPGNFNYDPYMFGMANGMILMLATVTGTEPAYLDPPKKWLHDKDHKNESPSVPRQPRGAAPVST